MIGREHFWPCRTKTLQTNCCVSWIFICIPKTSDSSVLTWYLVDSRILQFDQGKNIFDHTQPKIFKLTFIFLRSISPCKKSRWLTQFLLRYSWFKNPKIWLADTSFQQTWLKLYKPSFMFLESISSCRKSRWLINSYLR